MLQETFVALVRRYTADAQLAAQLWESVQTAYSATDRHFHNLLHLEQMLNELTAVQLQIQDWDTMVFSVFYHDIVYDVIRYVTENDNEEQSAEAAEKALQSIGYPVKKIEQCKGQILATKKHEPSGDDGNFLTDADLSILGQPWNVYERYRKAIRHEFAVYPDNIYHAGRAAVLKNFLRSSRLFKTEHFFNRYEAAARENIERELEIVSFH